MVSLGCNKNRFRPIRSGCSDAEHYKWQCALAVFTLGLLLLGISRADAADVLLLNSFHQGHQWTDEITRGVYAAFSSESKHHTIYTEQMDAMRFRTLEHRNNLTHWLSIKYRKMSFKVIITSDDIALNYILQVRGALFPQTPVVFCGANFIQADDLDGMRRVTGVRAAPSLKNTIALILSLHPDTHRIITVNDRSTMGLKLTQRLAKIMRSSFSGISYLFFDNLPLSQLIQRTRQLSAGDILLYLTPPANAGAGSLQAISTLQTLSKRARVPIYSVWGSYLGHGIVGGQLVSGFEQGQLAGRQALAILAGDNPKKAPKILNSPNRFMFNYQAMHRFSIDLHHLPQNSTIINQPHTIFTRHRTAATAFLMGVIVLHFIIFFLVLNILQRRRAEADILKTQRRFNTILETAKEGFVEINPQTEVLDVNPEMCALIGRPRQEIIGRPLTGYLAPTSAEQLQRQLNATLNGIRCSFEITILQKDQTRIACLFHMSPIVAASQAAPGCFAMVSDVTELKQLESQLLQAQKMEAIGNLAGGIAHDFNNRLQTISGYTQLLLHDENRSQADMTKLNAIERSVRSSCELIDQLLMFSRKIESKLIPTDLNHEVRQIQRLLERTIPRMIRIQLELAPDIGIINADPPQIEQVIMNLGINASHAMPMGGTLTLCTENTFLSEAFCKQNLGVVPGNFVRLRIKDTGEGMSKTILDHIFEPFFTTKYPGKGTGLGLSMVHGIIKNHNGHITCHSRLKHGSCFNLYFPILPVGSDRMPLYPAPEPQMIGGEETIFIIEDEEENLNVGKSMLQRFGYTVLTARNYNEALLKFSEGRESIALTLLDLNMPGTGGQSILQAILAMAPSTKILIASGFSSLAVKHALASGASGYIRKPYQMSDLLRQIRNIIDKG